MNDKRSRLEELLKSIPGSYTYFVNALMAVADRIDNIQTVIDYVEKHRNGGTSECIKYLYKIDDSFPVPFDEMEDMA